MQEAEYRKILSDAVGKEVEAYNFYAGAAQKTQDRILKSIFTELADEEKKHRSLLEGYLKNQTPVRFNPSKDYKVSNTVERPPLSLSMKPVDAVALAMKKEEDAMNLYRELATCSMDPEQKDVFLSLSNMEMGHKTRLENIYTNMAFPEAW